MVLQESRIFAYTLKIINMNSLNLTIYLKNNKTACMRFKCEDSFFRINHLSDPLIFAASLGELSSLAGKGVYLRNCLELCDKKRNEWSLSYDFSDMQASLALWFKSSDRRHQAPKFTWNGTVPIFRGAVAGMLRMLD